jgi:hypothetical protein
MKASVFVGTSVDGFIARYNGDFEFLPEGGGNRMATPNSLRQWMCWLLEEILLKGATLDTWPYQDMRVVVLRNRAIDTSVVAGARAERMGGPPLEIVNRLAASGEYEVTATMVWNRTGK